MNVGAASRSTDPLAPLDARRVRLGGEIGRRIDITLRKNLMALDADGQFLRPFLGGESRRYVGLGKLIDAAVHFALYAGDRATTAIKDHLVGEAIRAQHPDGYLGTMSLSDRMRREYDIHEMAYLVLGLAAEHRHYGNPAALAAATRLADYLIRRWPDREPSLTTLGVEAGLMALAAQSGQRRYLEFGVGTPMGRLGNQALREWRHPTQGHVYRYLARAVAQLDLFRVEGDAGLLVQTQQALDFLNPGNGMVITGTCSHGEAWHDTQVGEGRLGETCATAYLIRLVDNALRLTGQVYFGDLMERAIYNALFAAQSPDGRHLRYFTPFAGPRRYFQEEGHVALPSYDTYCCPNNYRRIVSELPTMVYYTSGDGLLVNLYTASTAECELASGVCLTVRQETDYPNTGRVIIHLEPSAPTICTIGLRIPGWCREGRARVDGERGDLGATGGQCLRLRRTWRAGDRIALDLSIPWRTVRGRAAQEGRVAVMRGPAVYCLSRQRNRHLEGVDLEGVALDTASLAEPTGDDGIRPDGLACSVRAWSPGRETCQPADLALLLTEFPDPTGEATYFATPHAGVAVADELDCGIRLGPATGVWDTTPTTPPSRPIGDRRRSW